MGNREAMVQHAIGIPEVADGASVAKLTSVDGGHDD